VGGERGLGGSVSLGAAWGSTDGVGRLAVVGNSKGGEVALAKLGWVCGIVVYVVGAILSDNSGVGVVGASALLSCMPHKKRGRQCCLNYQGDMPPASRLSSITNPRNRQSYSCALQRLLTLSLTNSTLALTGWH